MTPRDSVLVSVGHPAPDWTRTPAGRWTGTSPSLSFLEFNSLEHLQRPSGVDLMPHASCSSFIEVYISQTVGTSSGQIHKIRLF